MKRIVIIIVLILVVIQGYAQSLGEYTKFVQYLNEYRQSKGLSTLTYDKNVEKSAQIQCDYLSKLPLTYWKGEIKAHYNPQFPTTAHRLKSAGYITKSSIYTYDWGENCQEWFNYTKAELNSIDLEKEILKRYINSPSHNETLLKANMTKIGFYTIYNGKDLFTVMVVCN